VGIAGSSTECGTRPHISRRRNWAPKGLGRWSFRLDRKSAGRLDATGAATALDWAGSESRTGLKLAEALTKFHGPFSASSADLSVISYPLATGMRRMTLKLPKAAARQLREEARQSGRRGAHSRTHRGIASRWRVGLRDHCRPHWERGRPAYRCCVPNQASPGRSSQFRMRRCVGSKPLAHQRPAESHLR